MGSLEKRPAEFFSFFGPLIFTMTLVLIYYLNFKYGHSQSPDLGDIRRARGA